MIESAGRFVASPFTSTAFGSTSPCTKKGLFVHAIICEYIPDQKKQSARLRWLEVCGVSFDVNSVWIGLQLYGILTGVEDGGCMGANRSK